MRSVWVSFINLVCQLSQPTDPKEVFCTLMEQPEKSSDSLSQPSAGALAKPLNFPETSQRSALPGKCKDRAMESEAISCSALTPVKVLSSQNLTGETLDSQQYGGAKEEGELTSVFLVSDLLLEVKECPHPRSSRLSLVSHLVGFSKLFIQSV